MPNFKLLSKRKQQITENPDVYQYDVLPEVFRNQVIHILASTIGAFNPSYRSYRGSLSEPTANQRWRTLFARYTREIGAFSLGDRPDATPSEQCFHYLQSAATAQALDFIECAFRFINEDLRQDSEYLVHMPGIGYGFRGLDEAIEELNQRFQEHRIGYQFQSGQLIKRTDQYLHEEVLLPALTLLADPQFRGAQEEFLKAHQHYREQRYKEAIADALKAFESIMKSILDAEKWLYNQDKDTSSALIQALLDHELIPPMLLDHFKYLRTFLDSGLPKIRNRTSGHGQGTKPVALPEYVAEFALHLAAANIVFLVHAYEEYKKGTK